MRINMYKPWAFLCLLALLTACSDDGEDKTTPVPTAKITAVQTTVEVGQIVQLSGEQSTSPNHGYLDYNWSLTQKPGLSQATILQQDQATTSFHADVPGNYTVSLVVVNDGRVLSQQVSLDIRVTSELPVAVAETELFRLVGKTIELDGSASTPPEGEYANLLTYAWEISSPQGVTTTFSNANTAWPSFTPNVEGLYIATLTVTHGSKVSKPLKTYITVTTGNAAPEARITITEPTAAPYYRDQPINLSAATSTDADGDTLHYRWRFTARPAGSQAVLNNAGEENASFTPDVTGSYTVQLDAFDGTVTSQKTQNISATLPSGADSRLPEILYFEVINGSYQNVGNNEVEFATSNGIYAIAYDPDGGSLRYKWEAISDVPAGWKIQRPVTLGSTVFNSLADLLATRTGATTANFIVIPPSGVTPRDPVDLKMRVTVYDAQDSTQVGDVKEFTLRLMNGANNKPGADITTVSQTITGSQVLLKTGTVDSDGNQIIDHQWELLEKPVGSNATIANPKAANTYFIADKVGNYRISIVNTDSLGLKSNAPSGTLPAESIAVVTAKPYGGRNNRPTARFVDVKYYPLPPGTAYLAADYELEYDSMEQVYHYTLGKISEKCSFYPLNVSNINCEDSLVLSFRTHDPDGDKIIYDIQLEQPAGSNQPASFSGNPSTNSTASISLFSLNQPGDYRFTLQALDGSLISAPQNLTVRVADYPADYKAFRIHYKMGCGALKNGFCQVAADGSDTNRVVFLPMSTGNGANDKNTYEDYFQQGDITTYFVLEAIGQDYTLEDIEASISITVNGQSTEYVETRSEYQPRFTNLPADNIIRAGERRVIGIWIPKMLERAAATQSVYYNYQFYVKEERDTPLKVVQSTPGSFSYTANFTVPAL